eukprot:scaffold117185_cov67-Phaeocystis_antarctica.AAC.2
MLRSLAQFAGLVPRTRRPPPPARGHRLASTSPTSKKQHVGCSCTRVRSRGRESLKVTSWTGPGWGLGSAGPGYGPGLDAWPAVGRGFCRGRSECLDASHVPAATAKEMVADHKRWHTYRMDKTGQ